MSEQWRLNLLLAQAKLMLMEGETNGTITELQKTLAEAQSGMSMGEEKI